LRLLYIYHEKAALVLVFMPWAPAHIYLLRILAQLVQFKWWLM